GSFGCLIWDSATASLCPDSFHGKRTVLWFLSLRLSVVLCLKHSGDSPVRQAGILGRSQSHCAISYAGHGNGNFLDSSCNCFLAVSATRHFKNFDSTVICRIYVFGSRQFFCPLFTPVPGVF